MESSQAHPELLYHRTWRSRHPLRPRLSGARRWGMLLLLVFLCTVIFGYGWLTDSNRVRAMAGVYLSDLMGGNVEIGKANLSIFEGLRLDDVVLKVDGGNKPDSVLFTAQTFLISYNPAKLLAGKLEATQIVAIDPKVMLVEDPLTNDWNYQRLGSSGGTSRPSGEARQIPKGLPEIILRDAQVNYQQMRDGKVEPLGWISLEGHMTPGALDDRYDFELQSRGRESLGPSMQGTVWTGTGEFWARLKNFTFGPDIKSMLPGEVRAWWEAHDLTGELDIPELSYKPKPVAGTSPFRVETTLRGVDLTVRSQEWMSRAQNKNIEWFHDVLRMAQARGWLKPEIAQELQRMSSPQPIHLQDVSGTFVFTDKGIEVNNVKGRLDTNWISLKGSIGGYTPDAPATVMISSLPGHQLNIPPWSMSYAGSLPREMREVYENLRPQGLVSAWVKVERQQAGGRPSVSGEVDIENGQFRFIDLPYPLVKATGKIIIGYDSVMDMDGIRIVNVRGCGPEGGPNANSYVYMDGFIGPLDPTAGAWLDIHGENISDEPSLRAAFPLPVKRALRVLDADGKGEYPKFRASFVCHCTHPVGLHKEWTMHIDITADNIEGKLKGFPYPLKGLSCRMEVGEGYLKLISAEMKHGEGVIGMDGAVTWKAPQAKPTTRPYGPDLNITARNVPLDADLLKALPAGQQPRLRELGASGKLDVDGHLFTVDSSVAGSDGLNLDYVFNAKIHDGSLRPGAGAMVFSNVNGAMRVTPQRLEILGLSAQRGEAEVQAHGEITWEGQEEPRISVTATARKLAMDVALYGMLPMAAKEGWDAVKPEGTVDASLKYSARLDGGAGHAASARDIFELTLQPRQLAVTPGPLPYRLTDLTGSATITPSHVVLNDMTGKHGESAISFAGEGNLGGQTSWDLRLSARDVTVDGDLVRAVPDSVAGILKSLNARGKFTVEFSKLAYRPGPRPDPAGKAAGPDIDFAAKVTFNGTAMDAGIPLAEMYGTMDLAGLVRGGHLYRLAGQLNGKKMLIAGRPMTDFSLALAKPGDEPVLRVQHVEGSLAGGGIAGDAQLSYPDDGPSKYDLSLVLRDADVHQLTNTDADKNIKGQLTASLTMSGVWGDSASRRGHGDVRVVGQDMYNIPIVLGLLQVTNLALPISSPFSEATSRYNIDGQHVNFEHIDLKSKEMTMSGGGQLDFGTKKVALEFVTDNPAVVAIPIIGPVIHVAKQELLKIHVDGTIQQPKVTASSFDTITTTVDEVFKSDDKK